MKNRHTEDAFLSELGKNRITRQRKTILSAICEANGTNAHMDANDLYLKVKERDKKISLSTVYRTLAVFTWQGLVRQLVLGTGRRFYEVSRLVESHHFVCLTCGGIFDLNPVLNKDERLLWQKEVEVVAVQVTNQGLLRRMPCKGGGG